MARYPRPISRAREWPLVSTVLVSMSYRNDVRALQARREGLLREIAALREPVRADTAARAALYEVNALLAKRSRIAPQVRTPCKEPWDAMRGDGITRRCDRCRKDVHDLSAMNEAEIEAFMTAPGAACATFYVRDDGTIVSRDCSPVSRRDATIAAATAVVTSLAFSVVAATSHTSTPHRLSIGALVGDRDTRRTSASSRSKAGSSRARTFARTGRGSRSRATATCSTCITWASSPMASRMP